MNNKGNALKILRQEIFYLIIIFLISALSIGKILNYYFFYDDFFLFYAIQFPTDKNSIFLSPDASAYRFLQPFFTPLFAIFGYQSLGYFFASFLLFIVLLGVFYLLVKSFPNSAPKLAFFSSAVMASGYIGVEAFTWNMGAGPNTTVFLTASLVTLLFIFMYFQSKHFVLLPLILALFAFTVYFFQFRSFLLFTWILFLVAAWFFYKKTIPKQFTLFLILLMLLGIFLYKDSFEFNRDQGNHIDFSFVKFSHIYMRNIGNIVFPSEIAQFISERTNTAIDAVELYEGLVSLLIFIFVPAWAFVKKVREFPILFFFSLSTLASALFLYIVIGFTINAPDVWYSSHRFHFIIVPFLAGFFGTVLVFLHKKYQILSMILLIFWVATHIVLSNRAIDARWENTIGHIHYFYKTLREYVPNLNKNSVLLITQGEPTPVSIFVSARAAHAYAGIAGFYGMTVDQLNIARSPQEAVQLLKDKGLTENNLYSLFYKRKDLVDLTAQTRDLLSKGKKEFLGTKSGNVIEFSNLSLPAYAPMYVDATLRVVPDFSNLDKLKKIDQVQIENSEMYFPLLIEQEILRRNASVVLADSPLSGEHEALNVVDGDYSTTWIPKEWGRDGVSIVVDFGQIRKVSHIVWSSSRTASWYVRMPSQYKVGVSKDGKNFVEVNSVDNAPILKSGEFFIEKFGQREIRFVKITIVKTRGGLLPAIDEIEAFNNNSNNLNFYEYFILKQNPERYFPDALTAKRYLTEILQNSVSVEFDWRVDSNTEYPVGQSILISQEEVTSRDIHRLLPVSAKELKSLRIKPANFPAQLYVEDLEIIYPPLNEFVKTN